MFSHPVFLFFDVSGGELVVIMLVVFLVFGPQKMPEIARKIGRVMNQVKKASNDLTREFREETSGMRDDIMSAQNHIKDGISSVAREMNKTKASVINDLKLPEDPENTKKEVVENTPSKVPPGAEPVGPSDKAG
ncbi:MAG: twin-arginine translocase TatA/TatE family subunit [Bacteroidetes bacterium]|nr:twin-arginine translocase TatA/TatE family subunit [Bacteroidota bacterium]